MTTPLILTPNRRLARFLRQSRAGKIESWKDWLNQIWQTQYEAIQGQQPLQCLNDWQSLVLWEEVVTEVHTDPLLNISQAVTHARQAWALAIAWQVEPSTWEGAKPETDSFLQWLTVYEQVCAANHFIDPAMLPRLLYNYWENNPERIPRSITLAGFDEFSPLQTAMIQLWEAAGANVEIEPPPENEKPYTYYAFNDPSSQLTQAALYAKAALESSPTLPIGIIIPAIQDDWANIYDTFTDVLGPEQPFNISAGQPLGQVPIIYAALQCLQPERIQYLLTTPYISGGITEQSPRALAALTLSQYEKENLPMSFVRKHESLPESFADLLNQSLDLHAQLSHQKYAPSQWIESLFSLLSAWGWPGDRPLSSEAYQAVKHFYEVISSLSMLDDVLSPCSYSKLLSLFSKRVHQTMFQAESQDKPVQVLGFLEAAGLSFSHLWVMDMGSDCWPAKPAPNPYIPIDVQVKLGFPHASFARELRFAQTMTQRMLTSADHIVMSYAAHGEDADATVLPTPLLSETPTPFDMNAVCAYSTVAQKIMQSHSLEPMPLPAGLPLQDFHLKGGASIFSDQSDCPFRAYAKHRLRGQSPEQPVMGLSLRVKGSVLHDVLEKIWAALKTFDKLIVLGQDALTELIKDSTQQVLASIQPALTPIESQLELQRMLPLLLEWFEHERSREPFQVRSLERQIHVELEGLKMRLRMDRLDTVQGQTCIIDYKTGRVDPKGWMEPRLDEPQLPLYACVSDPEPKALIFAQIRKDKMGWKGLGSFHFDGITQIEPQEWSEQIANWKNSFAVLANEYKRGEASVTPKRGTSTCQYCDCQSFCRINDAV